MYSLFIVHGYFTENVLKQTKKWFKYPQNSEIKKNVGQNYTDFLWYTVSLNFDGLFE